MTPQDWAFLAYILIVGVLAGLGIDKMLTDKEKGDDDST